MLATTCFSREELESFLNGWADDDLSGAIEIHLESCARCDDTLAELDTGHDTLIRTLQVKGSSSQPANAPVWVEQVANRPFDHGKQSSVVDDDEFTDSLEELGDYELVRVLGRGGMSVVFAARHKHLGREVALKVLLPTMQQHAVSRERFVREMRAVGGLDHASIVRATDAGEWNETLFLVMEQIDGVDLNRVARLEGPLRVADACAIGIEVARGLAHAHRQRVVHRDIKPSNLMLDRNGNVKILDFGLARIQSAACDVSLQTTMGQLLGTLDYMAPEQASGSEVDARADIYALGATLFKLLSGAPPHGRSADLPIIEYLHRLATSDAARLDQHRTQLPSDLIELIATMLQRDPARRITSADEVAELLRPFSDGADLHELAAEALEKTTDPQQESVASIKESLVQFWSKPAPMTPIPRRDSIGKVGWLALATGIISLVGLVALTIVLTLKSPEGEIRIESELDNVRVELVDEKDKVEAITVDQGGAITTVRAGRYRIRLDSPSNGIEVTPRDILVKKDKVVIAKVTKIVATKPDADDKGLPQDSRVPLAPQFQLTEVELQLMVAKQEPEQNAAMIKILEEKIVRLRALSRPIPTEPVYEGRTLADWVAQMKFEQEDEAKKTATSNVLKLVNTVPDEEKMALILDAGSRLASWGSNTIDQRIFGELYQPSEPNKLSKLAQMIVAADRGVAASHLVRALRSEEQRIREYAAELCVELRHQIQQGDWPTLLAALEARSKTDTIADRVITQLVYALCVPDATQSAKLLAAIDTDACSNATILTMMHAVRDRKLEVPHPQEVAWIAAYFDKVVEPDEVDHFWRDAQVGPFHDSRWDQVDDAQQEEFNSFVGPLLRSFEEHLATIGDKPIDPVLQLQVALKSKTLSRIIVNANLTGASRDKAVKLLSKRLEQLIKFRSQYADVPSSKMDTPAEVAVAILLLTGGVPESIKQLHLQDSGYMATLLATARKTLLPLDPRAIQGGGRGGPDSTLADWYPYELLNTLHETMSRMRIASRNSLARGTSSRESSLFQLLNINQSWRVDARLMIDYAANSRDENLVATMNAAEFIGGLLTTTNIAYSQLSHPQFAKTVTGMMDESQDQQTIELGFEIWKTQHGNDEAEAKLLGWLDSGDVTRTRAAMQILWQRHPNQIEGKLADSFVAAIDRIAEKQQLNARDMYFLVKLGDKSPHAGSHALKYLTYWLGNPDRRAEEADIARFNARTPALTPCLSILVRFPEYGARIKDKINQVLKDSRDTLSTEEHNELVRFLDEIPNSPK